MSKIVDAVTAVLLCDGELLMVQRQPFLSAFPGYHAFPGGKIDAADSEGIALPAFCGGFEPRLLRSLLREIIEELSVDLSQEPDVRIRPLGIPLTPQKLPVRFNTHFFAIELSRKPECKVDPHEIRSAYWATPAQWLTRFRDGQLLLAPPTFTVIEAFAADLGTDDVPGLDFAKRFTFELPLDRKSTRLTSSP